MDSGRRFLILGPLSFLLSAAFAWCPKAGFAASTATLADIDVYGTSRFTAEDARNRFGPNIVAWVDQANQAIRSRRPKAAAAADAMRDLLVRRIRTDWNLGWAGLSWTDDFGGGSRATCITLDVVEKSDLKTRMPFRKLSPRTFPDPGGLFALWRRYFDAGWALVRGGEVPVERAECKGFYCQWGVQTQDLQAMEDVFVAQVPAKRDALIRVLGEDRDPAHRSAAVYLLTYLPNGSGLPRVLLPALQDPDPEVRGAAMKVFSDLAVYHKDVYLPIERIAAMLDYPTVDDRNRALAVLIGVADNPAYRTYLISHAAEGAVKLLGVRQPASRDLAYAFLGILSKENFAETDLASWRQWTDQARRQAETEAAAVTGK